MKRILTAMITATLLTLTVAAAHAADIEVYSATGAVETAQKGSAKWSPATSGMSLKPGYTIRCGADGAAVLRWFSGNVVKLAPGATLTIDKISDTAGVYESVLNLSKGRIYARAEKLPSSKSSFQVVTPTATAGVRGTEFMADVADDAKKATFAVMDGQILVEAKSITVILDREFQISVDQDQPPGEIYNISGDMKSGLEQESKVVNQAAADMPVVVLAPGDTPAQPTAVATADAVQPETRSGSTTTTSGDAEPSREMSDDFAVAEKSTEATPTSPAQPAAAADGQTSPATPAEQPQPPATTSDKSKDKKDQDKKDEKKAEIPPPVNNTDADKNADKKNQSQTTSPGGDKKEENKQQKKDEKKPAQQTDTKKQGAEQHQTVDDAIQTLTDQILDYDLFNYIVDSIMMQ